MHWEKPASTPPPVGDGWVFRPYHQAASANVEMTAYVLMSIIMNAQKSDAIPTALPIVRWLTQQRNAQGGFSSTQVKLSVYHSGLAEIPAPAGSQDVMSQLRDYPSRQ